MAAISRIKPGQILYTLTKQKMGNTTSSRTAVHEVRVIEVDPEGHFVIASWNCNPARRYAEKQVKSWKVRKPEVKKARLLLFP